MFQLFLKILWDGCENCQQSITLKTLQQIMDRLKVDLDDIFPPQN